MTYDLVAIGNPVYDFISTPQISSSQRILSGCSTNVCRTAKKLGMKEVMLVGNVGSDLIEQFQIEMRRHDIKAMITRTTDRTTGFSIRYDERGKRTLNLIADAGKIPIRPVWRECRQTRYLVIGPVLQEVDVNEAAGLIGSALGEIFLDPQGLLRRVGEKQEIEHFCEKENFRKLVALVDFVKPNELEAEVITGLQDSVESAMMLVEWGAGIAIVTLGDNGSVVCTRGSSLRVPAFKTTAIDPTGAGEVYAGAFLAEYDRTRDPACSCLYASAAASMAVESSRPGLVVADGEVRRRARQMAGELRRL